MTSWLWLALAAVLCALPAPSRARLRLRALPIPVRVGVGVGVGAAAGLDPVVPIGERRRRLACWAGEARIVRWLAPAVALAVGLLAALLCGQVLVGLASAFAAGMAAVTLSARLSRSEASRARRDLRAALSMLDSELSAGAREQDALQAAALDGGSAPVFRRAALVAGAGGDVAAVFARAGPGWAGLAAAWALRSSCGAPLAEIVAKVEVDLAAADARDRTVDSALAGPRSSAAMLALLPVLGVLLGTVMGAHPLRFLLSTDSGSAVLLGGVVVDLLGLLWMRLLIRVGGQP